MCHFLTIAVPGGAVPEVPEGFRGTIRFEAHTNRSVTRHAPAGWTCFTVTSGGCSCGFYRSAETPSDGQARLEWKYRRKGWTEGKIWRALGDRGRPPARQAGLRPELLALVEELTDRFREIRLALHWYSGEVETEAFTLADAGRVSLAQLRQNPGAFGEESTLLVEADPRDRRWA